MHGLDVKRGARLGVFRGVGAASQLDWDLRLCFVVGIGEKCVALVVLDQVRSW